MYDKGGGERDRRCCVAPLLPVGPHFGPRHKHVLFDAVRPSPKHQDIHLLPRIVPYRSQVTGVREQPSCRCQRHITHARRAIMAQPAELDLCPILTQHEMEVAFDARGQAGRYGLGHELRLPAFILMAQIV